MGTHQNGGKLLPHLRWGIQGAGRSHAGARCPHHKGRPPLGDQRHRAVCILQFTPTRPGTGRVASPERCRSGSLGSPRPRSEGTDPVGEAMRKVDSSVANTSGDAASGGSEERRGQRVNNPLPPSSFCPNCGAELITNHCKARCPGCFYFDDCSNLL